MTASGSGETMVERVAMAIGAQLPGEEIWPGEPTTAWRIRQNVRRRHLEAAARAAIEAMRVPTEGMVEAAEDANADYRTVNLNSGARLGPEGIYRAMIDEALTPPDPQVEGDGSRGESP